MSQLSTAGGTRPEPSLPSPPDAGSSAGGRPREWDAATYDRVASPHVRWGSEVLSRLALAGDECVLDAGCGSGRVTEQLLRRLPRGQVLALDASAAMLAEARRRLSGYGSRVHFIQADLTQPLPLQRLLDAVFSTATFHWIADHGALFRHLAAAMRPGAQLVFQCGGAGNIASVQAALHRVGDGWPGPWRFATPEETRAALAAAGFTTIEAWLSEEPVAIAPGEPLETFLRTVILGAHLDRLPASEHAAFVKAVAALLPRPEIDYVRLNVVARRAG